MSRFIAAVAGCIFIGVAGVAAVECPEREGRWPYGAGLNTTLSGQHAYVAVRDGGLRVVDVSNPWDPIPVGQVETQGDVSASAVLGDHLYAALYQSDLSVFDISNPARPVEVGSLDLPGWGYDVEVSGDYAFVADGPRGLSVIDVSTPSEPTLAGSYYSYHAVGVAVFGNTAYVADANAGLIIVDVSIPSVPIEIGRLSQPYFFSVNDIAVSGDFAFLIDRIHGGFWVVDVGEPEHPLEVALVDAGGESHEIVVVEDHAFVAVEHRGLVVFDVSNPLNPTEVSVLEPPGYTMGVAISDGVAYLAEDGSYLGGLHIADVSDPSEPREMGRLSTMGWANDVVVVGGHAFVADAPDRLVAFDVSAPWATLESGSVESVRQPKAIAASGSYVYIAEQEDYGSGLEVFDISVPSTPVAVGYAEVLYRASSVAVSGSHAYVGARDLLVFDVSNPSMPVEVGFLDLADVEDVAATETLAFIADGRWGLRVIDVSDPSSPVEVGLFKPAGIDVTSVAVSGDHAYIVDDRTVRILDVSEPTSPIEVGSIGDPPTYPSDLYVHEELAYVTVGIRGLWVVDVSDPTEPFEAGRHDTADRAIGVTSANGLVFVADRRGGLEIFNPSDCIERLPAPRRVQRRVGP